MGFRILFTIILFQVCHPFVMAKDGGNEFCSATFGKGAAMSYEPHQAGGAVSVTHSIFNAKPSVEYNGNVPMPNSFVCVTFPKDRKCPKNMTLDRKRSSGFIVCRSKEYELKLSCPDDALKRWPGLYERVCKDKVK